MSDETPEPRVDEAVPKPDVDHLDENQKRALEAGDEMEHEHGERREKIAREAGQLGDETKSAGE